jgi:hypothetical protein
MMCFTSFNAQNAIVDRDMHCETNPQITNAESIGEMASLGTRGELCSHATDVERHDAALPTNLVPLLYRWI